MAKPGGAPIVKERPFFVDQYFAIYTFKTPEGKIVYFKIQFFREDGKTVREEKKFNVIKHNVLEAWQKLEQYADPIIEKLVRAQNEKLTQARKVRLSQKVNQRSSRLRR